jgi:hypothetical protein
LVRPTPLVDAVQVGELGSRVGTCGGRAWSDGRREIVVGGGGRLHKAGTHQGPLLLRVAPHSFRCQVRANAAPGATVQHIVRVSWARDQLTAVATERLQYLQQG